MDSPVLTYVIERHLVCELQARALNIFNFTDVSSRCAGALTEHGMLPVIVDLGKVTMIDSVGVGLLARMKKQLEEKGVSMSICNVTEGVSQVFRLLDIQRQFDVYATLHEAAV